VTLILVDDVGRPLGALPPYPVEMPFWPETWDVVAGARERFGVDVTVLRIVAAEQPVPPGGAVTYLAQTSQHPDGLLTPAAVDLSPHPLRAAFAEPGGPAATVSWAMRALAERGLGPVEAAAQRKTWNLSTIWRLDVPSGPVWVKEVPPFFGHEAAAIGWVAGAGFGEVVPRIIAADGGRTLMHHVPGDDLFGAPPSVREAIGALFHPVQELAATRVDELLAVGVPDQRASHLVTTLRDVAARHGQGGSRLRALVDGLDDRLARVAACGLPDTLVHGDLHPGNVRGAPDGQGPLVVIDWGDCTIGHPAFDILRLAGDVDAGPAAALVNAWAARWRAAVPGCDPLTALELLRPVAALRSAAAYAGFLDRIEPTEHPYHAADVPACLALAAELAAP
jgi:aminoglycoside phosphotransferase (APT) family kinase protein